MQFQTNLNCKKQKLDIYMKIIINIKIHYSN